MRGQAAAGPVTAPICPYCTATAVYLPSSAQIYQGRDYGPVWCCNVCNAYVGCHPGTNRPLGRLANAELRKWKRAVHHVFDPIWRRRYELRVLDDPKYKVWMARGGRYKQLAQLLGIPVDQCHIGMFDVPMCKRAVEICQSGQLAAADRQKDEARGKLRHAS
ncbi:MAG TPA: zinc-finger-containing protein [Steroidobacteraceae bacterium]